MLVRLLHPQCYGRGDCTWEKAAGVITPRAICLKE
jgi:hypothetical protein